MNKATCSTCKNCSMNEQDQCQCILESDPTDPIVIVNLVRPDFVCTEWEIEPSMDRHQIVEGAFEPINHGWTSGAGIRDDMKESMLSESFKHALKKVLDEHDAVQEILRGRT